MIKILYNVIKIQFHIYLFYKNEKISNNLLFHNKVNNTVFNLNIYKELQVTVICLIQQRGI